mmetsp:Transcript_2130/g.8301  ORF Transcript_2130/g.8301 Transcript_2130/m.8301 type:complete len:295 (-) Transcript_2130:221-1105(-)
MTSGTELWFARSTKKPGSAVPGSVSTRYRTATPFPFAVSLSSQPPLFLRSLTCPLSAAGPTPSSGTCHAHVIDPSAPLGADSILITKSLGPTTGAFTTLYTHTDPLPAELLVSLHTNDRLTNGTNSWYRSTSHTARQKARAGVFAKVASARTSLALLPGTALIHTATPSFVLAHLSKGAPPSSSYMSSLRDERAFDLAPVEASPPRSLHRGQRRPRYLSRSRSFAPLSMSSSAATALCAALGVDAGSAAGREASAARIADAAREEAIVFDRGSTRTIVHDGVPRGAPPRRLPRE